MEAESLTNTVSPTTWREAVFVFWRTSWIRRHPLLATLLTACVGFLGLNLVAYQQARAMTRFTTPGSRTVRPQQLSVFGKIGTLLFGVRVPRPENDRTPADIGLSHDVVTIAVNDNVKLESWVIQAPSARGTIVLFHGYADCKSSLLPEAAAFHEKGFDVWLIDFRGSGGSSEQYTTIGVDEGADVAASIEAIKARSCSKPLILYGRSMGAAAILRAMQTHRTPCDGVILESVFDRLLSTVGNRFHLMGLPAFPAANLLVYWGGVQCGFDGFRHNPADYAKACSVPTLMLHGESDPNARLSEARSVHAHLADKQAALEVFPQAGHSPLRNANPDQWQDAIHQYLERVVAQQQE